MQSYLRFWKQSFLSTQLNVKKLMIIIEVDYILYKLFIIKKKQETYLP